MREPTVYEIEFDEDGQRLGRYPWWFLKDEGDRLLLRGKFSAQEAHRIQIAASRYGVVHGLRLSTRNASVPGPNGYCAVMILHQGVKEPHLIPGKDVATKA